MDRRTFLGGLAALTVTESAQSAPTAIPVIDTHIHLFDTTRPQGVPWPPKDSAVLYKPALPPRYRDLALPHGIVGAIEVEASPLLEDNQWVLDICEKDPLLVGTVGDLEPGHPDFPRHFERFHRNPLFLGIRYGNLWDRDIGNELPKPKFVEGLKMVAQAGLVLDTANPDTKLVSNMLRTSDLVPNLRIVIDHLAQLDPPADKPAHNAYLHDLHELAKRPQVFVKISQVLKRIDGKVPLDPAYYKPRIDMIYDIFGPDKLIYGSDWPNSDQWGTYSDVFRLVHEYFKAKGREVEEKYYWRNSIRAYRWKPRTSAQPRA